MGAVTSRETTHRSSLSPDRHPSWYAASTTNKRPRKDLLCSIVPSPRGREHSKQSQGLCSIVPSPRSREHSKTRQGLWSIVPSPRGREHSKKRHFLSSIVPSPRGREHSKQSQGLRSIVPSPRSREHSKTRQDFESGNILCNSAYQRSEPFWSTSPIVKKNASQRPDGEALPLS
jgi:hypothetical protein